MSLFRWVVYRRTLDLMAQIEDEVLRVATYHLEQYTSQLYEAGRGAEASEIDRTAILDDAWAFEAAYCSARHRVMLAYFAAYRHAEAWGVLHDLFGGLGAAQGGSSGPVSAEVGAAGGITAGRVTSPRPIGEGGSGSGAAEKWAGMAANTPQPQLLAARIQLRRELLDLCLR